MDKVEKVGRSRNKKSTKLKFCNKPSHYHILVDMITSDRIYGVSKHLFLFTGVNKSVNTEGEGA